jgi:hypothetical protein
MVLPSVWRSCTCSLGDLGCEELLAYDPLSFGSG